MSLRSLDLLPWGLLEQIREIGSERGGSHDFAESVLRYSPFLALY